MQSFSWKVFAMTGDVDAYLLFKDFDRPYDNRDYGEEWDEDEADVEDFD